MNRRDLRMLLVAAVFGFLHVATVAAQEPAFDILLRGGRVLDGTGNPWYRADVGIRGGRIARVGDLADATAGRVIELDGRYVVPGFIDIHSHADQGLDEAGDAGSEGARRRAAPNLVSQGVTTVVVNQDGRSPWPIADQRARLESRGHGPNAALMVGHNTIRAMALGDDVMRPSTPAEVERMTELVEQGMAEGAYGLSAGLEYFPGIWSETSELFPLVEAAGRGGGLYIVHERSSGMTPMWFWPSQDDPGPPIMIETIIEDIEVAERTGVTTVATHIKARGSDFWGAGRALVDLIERARARGVPIWADQYPYNTTGSDGSTVLLPPLDLPRRRIRRRPAQPGGGRLRFAAHGSARRSPAERRGAARHRPRDRTPRRAGEPRRHGPSRRDAGGKDGSGACGGVERVPRGRGDPPAARRVPHASGRRPPARLLPLRDRCRGVLGPSVARDGLRRRDRAPGRRTRARPASTAPSRERSSGMRWTWTCCRWRARCVR